MKREPQDTPEDAWAEATWEGHEKAQLRRMALIPFARKLEMLEEMHLRFLFMQKSMPKRDNSSSR